MRRDLDAPDAGGCGALALPPRPPGSPTGSEFAHRVADLAGPARQQAAFDEIERGNVPHFLRQLRPVWLRDPEHREPAIRICVSPDYLAVGSDQDFLRVPFTYPVAAEMGAEFGFSLPTRKIVDAIYEQSDYHLVPQPLPPGPQMRSAAYSLLHQRTIEAQRAGLPLGALISGHKKDLVLTNRLFALPDRVAIYGWHRPDGQPIQPLSTVHGFRYADYSHGVRPVAARAWVDGELRPLAELLGDPDLAPLLTYEGELPAARLLRLARARWLGRGSGGGDAAGTSP